MCARRFITRDNIAYCLLDKRLGRFLDDDDEVEAATVAAPDGLSAASAFRSLSELLQSVLPKTGDLRSLPRGGRVP